ncbi:hypothetical protein [Parabacteroides sp. AM08-6]|uniref:hypothetical protein n=1 Tax=Parabacteroides sp. AM08-6 TaxID=2292053 RepID=UPI000EFECBB2|nr:hypothetical protein [Parabacteroides sp. AM08-6]RHJ74412.1 hypothetical protein DW103_17890 [Parabacteroides sp. AM08-6]
MKVNFKQPFKNYDGTNIKETFEVVEKQNVDGEIKDVVVQKERDKLISSMVSSILFIGKDCTNAEDKMKAFDLSQRIYKATSKIEISTEEASFIKKHASEAMIAGAYAQVVNLLENNTKEE